MRHCGPLVHIVRAGAQGARGLRRWPWFGTYVGDCGAFVLLGCRDTPLRPCFPVASSRQLCPRLHQRARQHTEHRPLVWVFSGILANGTWQAYECRGCVSRACAPLAPMPLLAPPCGYIHLCVDTGVWMRPWSHARHMRNGLWKRAAALRCEGVASGTGGRGRAAALWPCFCFVAPEVGVGCRVHHCQGGRSGGPGHGKSESADRCWSTAVTPIVPISIGIVRTASAAAHPMAVAGRAC